MTLLLSNHALLLALCIIRSTHDAALASSCFRPTRLSHRNRGKAWGDLHSPFFTSRTASLSPSGGGQKHHTAPVVSKLFSPATHSVNENFSSMVVGKRRVSVPFLLRKSCNCLHKAIRPGRLEQSILGGFSIAEQKARIELAAAYRMFAHMNWNEGKRLTL